MGSYNGAMKREQFKNFMAGRTSDAVQQDVVNTIVNHWCKKRKGDCLFTHWCKQFRLPWHTTWKIFDRDTGGNASKESSFKLQAKFEWKFEGKITYQWLFKHDAIDSKITAIALQLSARWGKLSSEEKRDLVSEAAEEVAVVNPGENVVLKDETMIASIQEAYPKVVQEEKGFGKMGLDEVIDRLASHVGAF